jgi:hypothetical protein
MFKKIKNLIVSPKNEWGVIEGENSPHEVLFIKYVLPLSLIGAVAAFIGFGVIGYSVMGFRVHSLEWGFKQAIVQWVIMIGSVYLTAFVINMLADTFGATKSFDKAFSLVAHAYLPVFLGGIFYILPSLTWLAVIPGIYGLYLLYIGLQPMMKVAAEKNTVYFVISIIVLIVVMAVLTAVMNAVLLRGMYSSFNSVF